MYYRNPRRKRAKSYFMPFVIIAIIFLTLFYGWRSVNKNLVTQNKNTLSEKVFLSIENGSAKAMTVGKEEWQNAPDKIDLYRGEKIKTGTDGRATLTFFEESEMRMNHQTEVEFKTLKKKNETYTMDSQLNSGEVWVNVKRMTNPDSSFVVSTNLLNLSTRGASFAIEYPGTVYVLEGSLKAEIKYKDLAVKEYNVGVGQQLIITEEGAESVKKGEDVEVIFALSEELKESDWYIWNQKKNEGEIIEDTNQSEEDPNTGDEDISGDKTTSSTDEPDLNEETDSLTTAILTNIKPSNNSYTNLSSVTVSGSSNNDVSAVMVNEKEVKVNSGKWTTKISLSEEGSSTVKISAKDKDGKVIGSESIVINYDTTAPEAPKITEPKSSNNDPIEITDIEQIIEGTVSKDAQIVVVNDYRLTQYVPGSQSFKYFAKVSYNNLKAGENEYKIYTEDKAGNKSEVITLILNLDESIVNEAKEEVETQSSTSTESAEPKATGGVSFTSPNGGKNIDSTETEFELVGKVPEGTTQVTVNDYALSLFKEGDTEFKYRAYASLGNLKIGQKNTYTAKAYDSDKKLIGQATIVIDVESGTNASPIINIPSSESTYQTNLDTIVIGGTVGKWVTRLYLNDKELKEYIPGSEKFSESVQLNEGENQFVIKAEKSGDPVGQDQITIIYQP